MARPPNHKQKQNEPAHIERLALSPAEAAESLGISERLMREILSELPHTKIRSRVLIPIESLKQWLRDQIEPREDQNLENIVSQVLENFEGEK